MSDAKLAKFRTHLENLKLIIIDEMSMVSSDMLYKIHQRLSDIFRSTQPFGGVGVMLVGDLMQLKPVKGNFIFMTPKNPAYKLYYNSDSLWHLFSSIVLKMNHRQGKDKLWTELLNRLRFGSYTQNDVELLNSRHVENNKGNVLPEACNLFYSNIEVSKHNAKMLEQLKTKKVIIPAVCQYPNGYKEKINPDGTIDSSPLLKNLEVKIGARVMVSLNMSVIDSIVNGSLGTIADIIFEENDPNTVKCVIVKFDNEKAGLDQRKQYFHLAEKGTPLHRKRLEYHLGASNSNKKEHSVKGIIIQFALKLAAALTGHKMQVNFVHIFYALHQFQNRASQQKIMKICENLRQGNSNPHERFCSKRANVSARKNDWKFVAIFG